MLLHGAMSILQRQRERLRRTARVSRVKLALLPVVLSALCTAVPARASLTVLVGEPFNTFGTLFPVGHTTVYLDRVCADGPLKLRMCQPGEQAGVAIARYNSIGPYDWIATPILQFLYAADTADEVLPYATPETVDDLRQQYRRRFLGDLFPDGSERAKTNSEWWESAGMAYSRRLWGYRMATTREQDEQFVEAINARPNRHRYRAYGANCANFAAEIVNLYFPGLVKLDRVADLGALLPKQVARCLSLYGKAHPEAQFGVVEFPQVPGSLRRSRPVRGGAEAFLKTKRYIFPLAIVQPEIAAALLVCYLNHGQWKVARPAEIEGPETIEQSTEPLLANR